MTWALIAAPVGPALAQPAYPSKPITYIVAAGPGVGNDVIARIVAQKLGEIWNPVVVTNVPGASGAIGLERAAKAAPDGHTIVIASTSYILNQYVSQVHYDLVKDFAPVSLSGSLPYVLAVHSSLPVKSVNELVAFAKSRPGKLNYAAAIGQVAHFMGEMLKSATGIDIALISYPSSNYADADVIAGRVEIWFTTMATALPQMKAGTVRVLGFSGDRRSPLMPNVPTMAEAGIPMLNVSASFFVLAPAATPKPVVAALNNQFVKAISTEDVRNRLAAAGVEPTSSTVEGLDALLKSEVARWSKIIKDSGIRVQ